MSFFNYLFYYYIYNKREQVENLVFYLLFFLKKLSLKNFSKHVYLYQIIWNVVKLPSIYFTQKF